jgi:hypothetical protein
MFPKMESLDPSLIPPRRLKLEPNWVNSTTDMRLAKRVLLPLMEKELPKRKESWTDIFDPTLA